MHRGSSSSGGRHSTGGSHAVSIGETIHDVGRTLTTELEQLARRTQENVEGLDAKDIAAWKESMLATADSFARLQFDLQQSRAILSDPNFDALFEDLLQDDGSADISAAMQKFEHTVNVKAAAFDANTMPVKDKLNIVFNIKRSGKRDASDDIEVVESEAREADFNCPYTGKPFDTPMKNVGCIHHLSKAGLDALLRSKPSAKCPQAGCQATWSKQSASIDEDFAHKMKRFFRLKANQQSARGDIEDLE